MKGSIEDLNSNNGKHEVEHRRNHHDVTDGFDADDDALDDMLKRTNIPTVS